MDHTACQAAKMFFLILMLTAHSVAQTSGSADTYTADVKTEEGVRKISFINPSGIITVFLPEDIAAQDRISGTIKTEPIGHTAEERAQSQSILNGYMIKLDDQKMVRADSVSFIWTPQVPKPAVLEKTFELLAQDGKLISLATVPIYPTAPNVKSIFNFPVLAQTLRSVTIIGPFDGDASNTGCSIGGVPLPIIAESPRKTICRSPGTIIGVAEIKVNEGKKEFTGQIRNIGVNLSAPKTTLIKGDTTTLKVVINGLHGIKGDVQIKLITTGSVSTQGGNTQMIKVTPDTVDPNGVCTKIFILTAVQSGSFSVTATVQNPVQQ